MPPTQPLAPMTPPAPIVQPPKSHAKIIISAIVLLVVVIAAVAYAKFYSPSSAAQQVATTTSQTTQTGLGTATRLYTNNQLGFQANVPSDWVVKESSDGGVSISSSDFETYAGSTTIAGASFNLAAPQAVDASLTDPNTYRQFVESQKSSDGSTEQEITLGGEVAFLEQTSVACGMGCDLPNIPEDSLQTVHNGKLFGVSFEYDHLSPDKQKILDTFIQSFAFLDSTTTEN